MNSPSIRFRNEETGQTRLIHAAEIHASWDQWPAQVKIAYTRRLRRSYRTVIQITVSAHQWALTMYALGRETGVHSFSDLDIERRNAEDFPSQQKAGRDELRWPR